MLAKILTYYLSTGLFFIFGINYHLLADTPPFKILYNNDCVNIYSGIESWHYPTIPVDENALRSTVDEVAGKVDVHIFSPGMGWIPWWKSMVYPADQHYTNWENSTGLEASAWGKYMQAGGDLLDIFVKRCRETNQKPFVSIRLNDTHNLEYLNPNENNHPMTEWVSQFCWKNLANLIDPNNPKSGFNWSEPNIPNHKLAFIEEISSNYDIEGIELDFMRMPNYFRVNETTSLQRKAIINKFISSVRTILDSTSKQNQHRWLCVRIPCYLSMYDNMGLDLPSIDTLGVDIVNVSTHFYTVQQGTDFKKIRDLLPDVYLYQEMHFVTFNDNKDVGRIRTLDEQFYSTANLAYKRGADGIELFNFVYYRNWQDNPPFHVINHLKNPEWLSKFPMQWYFSAKEWGSLYGGELRTRQLPKPFFPGEVHDFELELAIVDSLLPTDGIFRLLSSQGCKDCDWDVIFNGHQLNEIIDVFNPVNNPYENVFSVNPNRWTCYNTPASIITNGQNKLSIILKSGRFISIDYFDLILSHK